MGMEMEMEMGGGAYAYPDRLKQLMDDLKTALGVLRELNATIKHRIIFTFPVRRHSSDDGGDGDGRWRWRRNYTS